MLFPVGWCFSQCAGAFPGGLLFIEMSCWFSNKILAPITVKKFPKTIQKLAARTDTEKDGCLCIASGPPKTPPDSSNTSKVASTAIPKPPKTPARGLQDTQDRLQDASKTSPNLPRGSQTPPRCSRLLTRPLKMRPRGHQASPRRPTSLPRSLQDAFKTYPQLSQAVVVLSILSRSLYHAHPHNQLRPFSIIKINVSSFVGKENGVIEFYKKRNQDVFDLPINS